MFEIKNKRKEILDSKTDVLITDLKADRISQIEMFLALKAATSEYRTYWLELQTRDVVKRLAGTLIAELPRLRNEMILKGETAVVFNITSDLEDDECLAALDLVGADSASAHTEIAHNAGQPRLVSFRFESQLPPVLPRHIEAAQNVRAYFAPSMLGEDQPDPGYHVATINPRKN